MHNPQELLEQGKAIFATTPEDFLIYDPKKEAWDSLASNETIPGAIQDVSTPDGNINIFRKDVPMQHGKWGYADTEAEIREFHASGEHVDWLKKEMGQ